MDVKRYEGKLKKWNAERGFGFVIAADGGQEIFVHISAFPRVGRVPVEGESLTFEVEPDRNGKRSAVRVLRPGDSQPHPFRATRSSSRRFDTATSGLGFFPKLIVMLLLVAAVVYAYSRYTDRVAHIPAGTPIAFQPATQVSLLEPTQPAPSGFSCDGRRHCSQMTSCKEATLFQKNCPGMEMDGDGDGVPCEQQWCTNPFAK